MTELNQIVNDPNFIVEFAVGDPAPDLKPQARGSGIVMSGLYYDKVQRFIMKKAHMSREDIRIFDSESGRVVLVSHHPGKNPYDSFDPLGLSNNDAKYAQHGGEWESVCDVSSRLQGMPSFKIRPKTISRHGRQYIKRQNDEVVMNIGKMGKLKSQSLRPHFTVGREKDGEEVYTIVADMVGRTFTITNEEDDVVAQVAKTSKALILTAAFGSGSESTIDIAPGVDASTILAIVYGIGQVGNHFIKDSIDNYVLDPLQNNVTDEAINTFGLGGLAQKYKKASNVAIQNVNKLGKTAKFFRDNFFK